MVVGACRITLILHGNQSLKGKRQVVKSLADRVRGRFNVSVAEVGSNDLLQRAEIGISAAGSDRAFINSVLDRVIDYIEDLNMAEMSDHSIEIINM